MKYIKTNLFSYNIEWNDKDVHLEYTYEPGEPEVHTLPNGDPGYPGSSATVDIEHAWAIFTDVTGEQREVDIFSIIDIDLESVILENHE